jgi:hypothetical protein
MRFRFQLFVIFFISFPTIAQDRIFLDDMPHALKMTITSDTNLLERGFVFDSIFSKRSDTNLYQLDHDVFGYTDKVTGKLIILKIWKLPESWQTGGITPGISEQGLTDLLKKLQLSFSKETFKYSRYINLKRKKLQYEFCFPTQDYSSSEYPEYTDQLHYVVVRVLGKDSKAKSDVPAVF